MATKTIKTCDRCNAVITDKDGIDHTPMITIYGEELVESSRNIQFTKNILTSQDFDLCRLCQTAITDFIHGRAIITKC